MQIKKPLFLFLLIVWCVSCGTISNHDRNETSVLRDAKKEFSSLSANRPAWASISMIDEGDCVAFTGSSANTKTAEESMESAENNALKNISQYFGVSVSATFSEKRSTINGKDDYQISSTSDSTSRKIEIKKSYEEDPVTIRTHSGYVSYVKVVVPKTELARIQIELDGFGVWAIKSDIPEAAARIRDIFPVFGKHGVNINEQTDYSLKTPKQVFAENKKAFYLRIEVSETKAEEYSGEFYSLVEINAELFNLLTGETINRWTVEGKGAAYSAKEARENAVTKAVREIADQI